MVDLDYFKRINDTFGHSAGDTVLQAVANLLESERRCSDSVARYGGEEFCVLLPETDEDGAFLWAERVRNVLANVRVKCGGQELQVTGSFGVAARMEDTSRPEQMLGLADQALGVAKQSGRNRVVRFSALTETGPQNVASGSGGDLLSNVLARDVMSPAVYCPSLQDTVGQVADHFLQLRLNAAPVVDENECLSGMVTDNDLLATVVLPDGINRTIRECLKANTVHYAEETPIREIFRFLARAAAARVVIAKGSRPTGVISRSTLLRWLRNWHETRATGRPVPTLSRDSCRSGILGAARAAEKRLAVLREYLVNPAQDLVPCAVAEATRLEEFAHCILAHCYGQE